MIPVVDAAWCDAEPIHIPGATQPHGVLVGLDPTTQRITHVSANCVDYFGTHADAALGRGLEALLGHEPMGPLQQRILAARASVQEPVLVAAGRASYEALVHRHRGTVIVELERHDPAAASSDAGLRQALARLQQPNTVAELCAIAVEVVRALTGFDRVMLYQFAADGTGHVVAESTEDGVPSYQDLRFPAGDIPAQARQLYVRNWLRLIPDVSYTPVDLHAVDPTPLDLSFATLRSVSPVHVEYLHNMGVGASMSVSLVENNQLRGLIACHHRTPRHITFSARAACEVVGRVVALQIAAQSELDLRTARARLADTEGHIARAMRDGHTDLAAALGAIGDALLALGNATGVAVCTAAQIRTSGVTPTHAQLIELEAWLDTRPDPASFHTDALGESHPPACDYATIASSLLAVRLATGTPIRVLWFGPELVQTVRWAGNPDKTMAMGNDARLHPRRSFEAWAQTVRGRGRAWQAAELAAVAELRRHAVEIDLGNQVARAERAVRQRDDMVATVSHDLKGPLSVIGMATTILQLHLAENEVAAATVSRVSRAVGQMNGLIHDLLDLATIDGGRFELRRAPWAAQRLVADASSVLGALAEARAQRLTWSITGDPWVDADGARVGQVLANLVGNAIKFTPAGGAVDVAVARIDQRVQFAVSDTGPGIDAGALEHIFDRYWQGPRARAAGSGLGLYIARGIIEAHGERVWATSTPGDGATFYFTLPAA